MTAEVAAAGSGDVPAATTAGVPPGRFYAATVAFHRARQLQDNARPRLALDGHKFHRLALHEVMAGLVSWTAIASEAAPRVS